MTEDEDEHPNRVAMRAQASREARSGVPLRGTYVDPAQIPTTLMEPSMEAGQPPARQVSDRHQKRE